MGIKVRGFVQSLNVSNLCQKVQINKKTIIYITYDKMIQSVFSFELLILIYFFLLYTNTFMRKLKDNGGFGKYSLLSCGAAV